MCASNRYEGVEREKSKINVKHIFISDRRILATDQLHQINIKHAVDKNILCIACQELILKFGSLHMCILLAIR